MYLRIVTASFFVLMLLSFISNGQTTTNKKDQSARKDSLLQVLNFDTTKVYEPICLNLKGKPVVSLGQKRENLSDEFHYNLDPNGKYTDFAPKIWDYYSTYYVVEQTEGSLNGMLHFSTDNNGRIFTVGVNWLFDIYEMTEAAEQEILTTLSKLYPCLNNQLDFENRREVIIESKDYLQTFRLISPEEFDNSFKNWRLSYAVEIK